MAKTRRYQNYVRDLTEFWGPEDFPYHRLHEFLPQQEASFDLFEALVEGGKDELDALEEVLIRDIDPSEM